MIQPLFHTDSALPNHVLLILHHISLDQQRYNVIAVIDLGKQSKSNEDSQDFESGHLFARGSAKWRRINRILGLSEKEPKLWDLFFTPFFTPGNQVDIS